MEPGGLLRAEEAVEIRLGSEKNPNPATSRRYASKTGKNRNVCMVKHL